MTASHLLLMGLLYFLNSSLLGYSQEGNAIFEYVNNCYVTTFFYPDIDSDSDSAGFYYYDFPESVTENDGDPVAQNDEVMCPDPSTPRGGLANYEDLRKGAVVKYSCLEGYTLQGLRTRVCNKFGEWSGSTPVCMKDG